MQIKNVINENEYEFSQSALASSFASISSLSSNYLSTSLSTSSSSSKENVLTHYSDLLKLCVLLFDIYQKLFSTNAENKLVHISRQSVQESLLPGLNCLKDIFLHSVINSNAHNEYVQQIDQLIYKTELIQQNTTNSSSEHQILGSLASSFMSSSNSTPTILDSSVSLSPLKGLTNSSTITHTAAAIGDMVNAGVSTLAANGSTADNANFKSFVFKGISNFKDHSKDKLSNFLLTNKTFKK